MIPSPFLPSLLLLLPLLLLLLQTPSTHSLPSTPLTRFSPGSPPASRRVSPCGTSCRYRFCDASNELLLIVNRDIALGPRLCLGNIPVLRISTNTEPIIRDPRTAKRTRISRWRASTSVPAQPLAPTFFKFLRVAATRRGRSPGVGVAHETPQGDQAVAVKGRCVLVPVDKAVVADDLGEREVAGGGRRDCVGFTTVLPRIVVELTWQSGDDLDLVIVDPAGEELSVYASTETSSGELLFDDGVSRCGERTRGREVSVFGRVGRVRRGRYVAYVRHWENCEGRSTAFKMRVFVDGVLRVARRGASDVGEKALVEGSQVEFEFPGLVP